MRKPSRLVFEDQPLQVLRRRISDGVDEDIELAVLLLHGCDFLLSTSILKVETARLEIFNIDFQFSLRGIVPSALGTIGLDPLSRVTWDISRRATNLRVGQKLAELCEI